jgi:hypothetical protein
LRMTKKKKRALRVLGVERKETNRARGLALSRY